MLDNLKNSFDFFIREKTRFSRKNYVPNERERMRDYLKNLWVLDVLDKYFPAFPVATILDIGSKNWAYASAEHAFFKTRTENFTLTGVELDAHRLYSNFYSRAEVAKFHIKNLPEANYIAGDLLSITQKFDAIIWFLPFLNEHPHKKWGLPMKHFKPEALLKHAYSLLNPEGAMLIVNQGEDEYETQQKLLQKLNIAYTPIGEIKSVFSGHKLKRFATLAGGQSANQSPNFLI